MAAIIEPYFRGRDGRTSYLRYERTEAGHECWLGLPYGFVGNRSPRVVTFATVEEARGWWATWQANHAAEGFKRGRRSTAPGRAATSAGPMPRGTSHVGITRHPSEFEEQELSRVNSCVGHDA